jgi:hypothetical protein
MYYMRDFEDKFLFEAICGHWYKCKDVVVLFSSKRK